MPDIAQILFENSNINTRIVVGLATYLCDSNGTSIRDLSQPLDLISSQLWNRLNNEYSYINQIGSEG